MKLQYCTHIFENTCKSYVMKIRPVGAEWSVFLTQYCAGGKIEKNEMGGACGGYGRGERCAQGYGGETWGEETTGETQM